MSPRVITQDAWPLSIVYIYIVITCKLGLNIDNYA